MPAPAVPAPTEPAPSPPASDPTAPLVEPVDEAPRQAPPENTPGSVTALPPRFGALGGCTVTGLPRRSPIRVDPASGGPFLVHVNGAPIDVTFGKAEGGSARVQHAGAIRFEGSVRETVLMLKKGVVRHDGMVRAPRGARLSAGHEVADGQVRVETSTEIPIEVPCDHLAFGAREPPGVSVAQRLPIVVPIDETPLLLAASPRAVPTLPLPSGMVFTRTAGGVDFVKISHRGWDGVTVSGYLPTARLMDGGVPGMGGGGMGCGCGARGFAMRPRGPNDPYEGPAKLRDGAPIHAERDGGVWARGAGGAAVAVSWKGGGDPWVRLLTIPNVDDVGNNPCNCAGISHAFVLRDRVEF